MISFGSSKELCGGIHVPATGSIGLFRIVSESAVASGIRRIEAVTGAVAYQSSLKDKNNLKAIGSNFKGAKDLVKAVNDLQKNLTQLSKEVEELRRKEAGNVKDDLITAMKEINGVNFLAVELNLDAKSVKDLAFQLKTENAPFYGVFAIKNGPKVNLSVAISDDVISSKGMNAGDIVKKLATSIRGGGGGQPTFAKGGSTRRQKKPSAKLKAP